MYQISPERKLLLPCRVLLCEACWAKGYLQNKDLEYGIILFFLSPISKEVLIVIAEKVVNPGLKQVFVLGFIQQV